MLKIIILLIINSFLFCSTPEVHMDKKFEPNKVSGCSAYTTVDSKLSCIKKMIKTLESINNASLSIVEKNGNRYDEQFIEVVEEVCIKSQEGEKLYCWDNSNGKKKLKYDPTLLGKIYNFATKFGLGLLLGLVLGISGT